MQDANRFWALRPGSCPTPARCDSHAARRTGDDSTPTSSTCGGGATPVRIDVNAAFGDRRVSGSILSSAYQGRDFIISREYASAEPFGLAHWAVRHHRLARAAVAKRRKCSFHALWPFRFEAAAASWRRRKRCGKGELLWRRYRYTPGCGMSPKSYLALQPRTGHRT